MDRGVNALAGKKINASQKMEEEGARRQATTDEVLANFI